MRKWRQLWKKNKISKIEERRIDTRVKVEKDMDVRGKGES